jgi:hypothetical protein
MIQRHRVEVSQMIGRKGECGANHLPRMPDRLSTPSILKPEFKKRIHPLRFFIPFFPRKKLQFLERDVEVHAEQLLNHRLLESDAAGEGRDRDMEMLEKLAELLMPG